jgi:hypothetical protein
MNTTISVSRAVWTGLLTVNGPVLLLLVGPLYSFGLLVERSAVSRAHNWVGVVIFALGFALAWLWWSLSVPRWRVWAYERVQDIPLVKERAVAVGLTWPSGHRFGKTEIKSRSLAQRERELDPPYDA